MLFFFFLHGGKKREERIEKVALTIYPINTIERAALTIYVIHTIDSVYTRESPTMYTTMCKGTSCSSVGKESVCNSGDPGSVPGSGRSPREGNGNPLQDSSLENPMDKGAWQALVYRVAKSQT